MPWIEDEDPAFQREARENFQSVLLTWLRDRGYHSWPEVEALVSTLPKRVPFPFPTGLDVDTKRRTVLGKELKSLRREGMLVMRGEGRKREFRLANSEAWSAEELHARAEVKRDMEAKVIEKIGDGWLDWNRLFGDLIELHSSLPEIERAALATEVIDGMEREKRIQGREKGRPGQTFYTVEFALVKSEAPAAGDPAETAVSPETENAPSAEQEDPPEPAHDHARLGVSTSDTTALSAASLQSSPGSDAVLVEHEDVPVTGQAPVTAMQTGTGIAAATTEECGLTSAPDTLATSEASNTASAPVLKRPVAQFMMVRIDKIVVEPFRRSRKSVEGLGESMDRVGMLHPVTLTPIPTTDTFKLRAGEERLDEAMKLSWVEVPALILDVDDLLAELASIDENLIRKDETALQRAENRKRRKELYEELYPKSVKPQGGRPPKNQETISSFSEDTARKTGKSRRDVDIDVQIARDLGEPAKEIIRGTDVEDQKVVLRDLSRVEKPRQPAVAKVLVNGQAKTVKDAQKIVEDRKRARQSPTPPAPLSTSTCEIVDSDCLIELARQQQGQYRLIVLDPPQNDGTNYGEGSPADRLPQEEYLARIEQWLDACIPLLKPDGSLWHFTRAVQFSGIERLITRLGLHLVNWVIVYEPPGVPQDGKLRAASLHLLQAVKDPTCFMFRPAELDANLPRPKKEAEAVAALRCRPDDDVWIVPRIQPTDAERIPWFPVQRRLALFHPIVSCSTEPADWILDPFCGSGTAGVVALELGRHYLGIEKNPQFAEQARQRLAARMGGVGRASPPGAPSTSSGEISDHSAPSGQSSEGKEEANG